MTIHGHARAVAREACGLRDNYDGETSDPIADAIADAIACTELRLLLRAASIGSARLSDFDALPEWLKALAEDAYTPVVIPDTSFAEVNRSERPT